MTKKQITMNQAFKDLEALVDQFEAGEIDLETSLDKFKQGLELAKFLKQRLAKLENDIEEIQAQYHELATPDKDLPMSDKSKANDNEDELPF